MTIIDEILTDFSAYHLAALTDKNYIAKQEEVKQALYEAMKEVIGVAPSCEEDCTPERHAYHQGGYDLSAQQLKRLDNLFGVKK